jgi:hypothetical protein
VVAFVCRPAIFLEYTLLSVKRIPDKNRFDAASMLLPDQIAG